MFREAWRRLQEIKQVPATAPPLAQESYRQWQQKKDMHRRPLLILALAIRLMLDPNAKELGGKEIIRDLIQKYEIIRLKAEAKKLNVDEYSLVMLRAVAAISGQIESEALRHLIEASAKLNLDIKLPTLRQLKETSLWINGSIHALQPDLLSADLMHYALTELADDQSGAWQYCGLEAATDIAVASSIFGRLIHDAQNILDRPWPLPSLIDWVCREPKRCEKLASALVRNTLERTLLPLAIATNQALLARADSPKMQAKFMHNLSVNLAHNGERKAALQVIQRSVEIFEQLAKENFAAYGPDLASSLHTLSNRLADSGERAAALQAIQRAVDICEQLAKENFAAYGPDLASSLNNLSNHLADNGERKDALQAIQQAVEIYEQLAKENFAACGPDLARSLNNLSNGMADSGERAAALQVIQRAAEIYEQLAKENFAAYGPDLAMSLNNLSNRLADHGERAAALQAIQRAVDIREQLAKENFAAYGPNLAMSLHNLSIHLAKLDKTKEEMETKAKLEILKQQILDEQIQVPAFMARLFE